MDKRRMPVFDGDRKIHAEGVTVTTLSEDSVGLDSLWADRQILLAFLRHFG